MNVLFFFYRLEAIIRNKASSLTSAAIGQKGLRVGRRRFYRLDLLTCSMT
jgi:hypothetical protein